LFARRSPSKNIALVPGDNVLIKFKGRSYQHSFDQPMSFPSMLELKDYVLSHTV
jgi:hypothetical protein